MEELVPFVLEPRIEVSQNGGHNTHRNMQIAHPSGEDGTFDQYEDGEHHKVVPLPSCFREEDGTFDQYEDGEHHKVVPLPSCFREDDFSNNRDFAVKGKKRDDDTIFLRLRITDKEGRIRNIYFPFDVEGDTSLSVASEMVTELDITDQDVTKIADMIDAEILELVPDWKAGADREDCPDHTHFLSNTFLPANFSNCYSVPGHTSPISSDSSLLEYMESYDFVHNGTEAVPCTHVECAAVHGRFEEVTYKVDGPDFSSNVAEETSNKSSDVLRYDADDCVNGEGPISPKLLILHGSGTGRSDESQCCQLSSAVGNKDVTDPNARTESTRKMGLVDEAWRHGLSERFNPSHQKACFRSVHESQVYPTLPSSFDTLSDEDEGSVSRALRLLTANYREELKELQRKHKLALLEIQNHWRKNKKAPRVSPNRAKFSTEANDQEWKMSPNAWQEHQKNDRSRRCRAALDTLKYESKEFESAGMKRLTSDVGRMGISGIHSFRSLPAASSPPPRPDMRNSPPNRRLAKMHSFGDVDGQLHVNSLATDIRNLQHDHAIGALRTQNPYISKSCHGGMRHPLSIPKRYSSGNYVEGRMG